jgi:hypothetical protein
MAERRPAGKPDEDRQETPTTTIRPSADDRCAECGAPVGHEWAFFMQDPATRRTCSSTSAES